MRILPRGRARALLLAVIGIAVAPLAAVFGDGTARAGDPVQNSVLQVPARGPFPMTTKIAVGVSKSLLVQFPFELRDVLVADPEKMDAVVQSSNRVFLIAKKVGQTNAFFFDTQGRQVLTLEISVGADLSALDDLIRRFVPGSSVKSEMAGNAIVLTGLVRTPVDAARAGDLAFQFAQANRNAISSSFSSTSKGGGDSETTQSQVGQGPQATSSKKSDLVINLLAIEGEEQVMLKVTVAEVQRTAPQAVRRQSRRADPIGQLSQPRFLSQNALPLTAAAGLGNLPVPAIDPATGALQLKTIVACHRRLSEFRRRHDFQVRRHADSGCPARDGARRPCADTGRAEPDCSVGRDGQVPGGWRVSRSLWSTAPASCPCSSRSSASGWRSLRS